MTSVDGDVNFIETYKSNCSKHDLPPVKAVIAFLKDGILDINGDKLSTADWTPLFETMISKNDLKFIAIRSYWKATKSKQSNTPAIQSKEVADMLVSSISRVLYQTHHLRCLELQQLPLGVKAIQMLSKSLIHNHTLQHLSLQQCPVNDEGLQVMCKALKTCFNITSINLIDCGLTWNGTQCLSNLVKHQTLLRNTNVWQASLRDTLANVDNIGGLQRLSLNDNVSLGDKGAYVLADILKEDVWLKAIDVQNCGIQDSGAKAFLTSLKCNSTLYILDIRRNSITNADVLLRITQQLSFNIQGQTSQYKWLPISTTLETVTKIRKKNGIPWRVNSRLCLSRCLPSKQTPGIANIFLQNKPPLNCNELPSSTQETATRPKRLIRKHHGEQKCNVLVTIEEEIKSLQNLLLAERALRLDAEKKTIELTLENDHLKKLLRAKDSNEKLDEQTLATIENTFANFNDFLKMFQSAG